MKDTNKKEISDFEKQWQKAFEEVEMPVENDVWSNIDAHLANKEAEKYKRKTVFYKWVAAASIIFAIALSYFSYDINVSQPLYVGANDVEKMPALALEEKYNKEDLLAAEDISKNKVEEGDGAASDNGPLQQPITQNNFPNNAIAQNRDLHDQKSNINPVDESKGNATTLLATSNEGNKIKVTENGLPLNKGEDPASSSLNHKTIEAESGDIPLLASDNMTLANNNGNRELSTIAIETKSGKPFHFKDYAQLLDPPNIYAIPGIGIKRETKANKEGKTLWAGLNLGSGVFDPNFQNGSNFQPKTSPALSQTYAREAPQAASFKESTNAGITYSLGVNFGVRLSEKWIVQSGVQYAQKNASTSSTTFLSDNYDNKMKPAYVRQEENKLLASSNITYAQEYDMLNSFEFASIPLKAGYLLIDRKVGLMVTAGIGADIFLSNTISETNDKLSEVTMEAGSDSPFREVNFNGLFGAEVFYQISKQYHLTLEPNYSIALSPFTKVGETFKSTPQTFGLTAGLKYYWK